MIVLVEAVLIFTAALFLLAGAYRLFKGDSTPQNKPESKDDKAV